MSDDENFNFDEAYDEKVNKIQQANKEAGSLAELPKPPDPLPPLHLPIANALPGITVTGSTVIHIQTPGIHPPLEDLLEGPDIQRPFPTPPSEVRRNKGKEMLKYFYKNNFNYQTPFPWFPNSTIDMDDYFTELIIKKISIWGRENRAIQNEMDYRRIFSSCREEERMRVLVEGSPGYGKTTLVRRIAVDWGRGSEYLDHFSLIIFITCRDLDGRNLEDYVSQTFSEKNICLEDWKDASEEILFILDGLDECKREDAKLINRLLEDQTKYPRASVLATSRPLSYHDTKIKISKFYTRVEIKGFNRSRVEKLIDVFFKNNLTKANTLKHKLFVGQQAYEHLVTCPLLCQLFCLLYEDDENLPDKTTDVYLKLIKCLINREKSAQGTLLNPTEEADEFTLIKRFGKMCISALEKDKFYFTKDEIIKVLYEGSTERDLKANVIMGFLVKTKQGRSNGDILDGQQCYQPLHKTFLEFVAGYYLHCLVRDQSFDIINSELEKLKGIEYSSVEQVLVFTVEMLADQAYHILKKLGNVIQLKDNTYLRLLSASGCTDQNVKALTTVMNLESVTVSCSLNELDAWTHICTQSSVIKSLTFKWDNNMASISEDKVRRFFEEMEAKNKSIETVEILIFHGTMKEHTHLKYREQRRSFLDELESLRIVLRHIMCKKNIKHLKIDMQIIQPDNVLQVDYSKPLVSTVVEVFKKKGDSIHLTSLNINIDLNSSLLGLLLEALGEYKKIRKLCLPRLCTNIVGFRLLHDYILLGHLKDLEVKLNRYRYIHPSIAERTKPSKPRDPSLSGINLGVEAFLNTIGEVDEESDLESLEEDPDEEVIEIIEADMLQEMSFLEDLKDRRDGTTWEIKDGTGTREPGGSIPLSRMESLKIVKKAEEWKDFIDNSLSELREGRNQRYRNISGVSRLQVEERCTVDGSTNDFLHVNISDEVCPLPVCGGHNGVPSGHHVLFRALKDPRCKLERFYLNQCLLLRQGEYFACLGEGLAENQSLKELKVDNMLPESPRVKFVLPLLLALRTNQHLTSIDFSFCKLQITSEVLIMVTEALSENKTLSSLDISGWKFSLDLSLAEPFTRSVGKFLKNTVLKKLNMYETAFQVKTGNPIEGEDICSLYNKLKVIQLCNSSVEELNLAKVDVSLDGLVLKAREFLHLVSFTQLRVLNISEPPNNSYLGQANSPPVDDSSLCNFFEAVRKNLKQLETLKLGNWVFSIQNPAETKEKLKNILKQLQGLNFLILDNYKWDVKDGVTEHYKDGQPGVKHFLLKLLVKHIPNLAKISLQSCQICADEVPMIYKALKHRVARNPINIYTLYMDPEIIKLISEKLETGRSFKSTYNEQSGLLNVRMGKHGMMGKIINRTHSPFIKQRSA